MKTNYSHGMLPLAALLGALALPLDANASDSSVEEEHKKVAFSVSGREAAIIEILEGRPANLLSSYPSALQALGYDVTSIFALEKRDDDPRDYERWILDEARRIHDEIGPLEVVVFNMHSSPYHMVIDGSEACFPSFPREGDYDETCVLEFGEFDFFEELRGYLAEDAVIILDGCSTGKGIVNMGTFVNLTTGATVFAPKQYKTRDYIADVYGKDEYIKVDDKDEIVDIGMWDYRGTPFSDLGGGLVYVTRRFDSPLGSDDYLHQNTMFREELASLLGLDEMCVHEHGKLSRKEMSPNGQ